MIRQTIKDEDLTTLLRTSPNAYTMDLLRTWIATTVKSPPLYPNTAIVIIPAEFRAAPPGDKETNEWDVRYSSNWSEIRETTVGRFIANNLVFSRSKKMRAAFPYYNEPWNDKTCGRIQQFAMDLFLAKEIEADDIRFMIDRMQWLGYAPTSFIAPSMTIDTIRIDKNTKQLKTDILKGARGDAIRAGDLDELGRTEKELIASAKKHLNGIDPGFDIFESGARGSVANNYKTTALMRGAIRKSDDPSVISISTKSLEEGIPIDEMHLYADIIVQASFGRSMMTAQGGYIAKQLNAAFQALKLNADPESNCHTEGLYTIVVDNDREYLFRFYSDSTNTLRQIMPADLGKFNGKVMKFRSPLYCGGLDGLCSKCAGTMYHRMGVLNIGLLASRVGTTLLNASLKSFHDATLKRTRIDISKYCSELPS